LTAPAARHSVAFEEDAARMVIAESGGYPYYLQEYGRVLWDEAEESPITLAEVKEVHDIVQDSLDATFFGPHFELATDAQQRYLLAMSRLGDGPLQHLRGRHRSRLHERERRFVRPRRPNRKGADLEFAPRPD
jgi:hypothetical protein